ncbi:MAG: Trm112 family protein [Rhodobacteraceae bacterium]|nr:Trm112 family protein [Paracoccaceae bacterium]
MTDDAAGEPDGTAERPVVDRRLLEILVCPVTRGPLVYDAARRELVSKGAGLAFQIHDGIPVMLIDEARKLDP